MWDFSSLRTWVTRASFCLYSWGEETRERRLRIGFYKCQRMRSELPRALAAAESRTLALTIAVDIHPAHFPGTNWQGFHKLQHSRARGGFRGGGTPSPPPLSGDRTMEVAAGDHFKFLNWVGIPPPSPLFSSMSPLLPLLACLQAAHAWRQGRLQSCSSLLQLGSAGSQAQKGQWQQRAGSSSLPAQEQALRKETACCCRCRCCP